jgi:inner membrane protein involved in colicin E2 resistance
MPMTIILAAAIIMVALPAALLACMIAKRLDYRRAVQARLRRIIAEGGRCDALPPTH